MLTFAEKAAGPGVFMSRSYDDQADMKYHWDSGYADMDAALTALFGTNYTISPGRVVGEGNAAAAKQGVGYTYPVVDNDNFAPGGGNGSLKFTIPGRSFEDCSGEVFEVLRGTLGEPFWRIDPNSEKGRILYIQFMLRQNAANLTTSFRRCRSYDGVISCTQDSTTIVATGIPDFSDTYTLGNPTGREIFIFGDHPSFPNWVFGYYTIISRPDNTHLELDRTPCPDGNGTFGYARLGGPPWTGRWNGTLYTSGAGSLILISDLNSDEFHPNIPSIQIYGTGFGTGFSGSDYTVDEWIDPHHILLTTSPTPSAAGVMGYGRSGNVQGGGKVMFVKSQPPYNYSGDSYVLQDTDQFAAPQMYGQVGTDSPGVTQIAVPFVADEWQEVNICLESNVDNIGGYGDNLSTSGAGSLEIVGTLTTNAATGFVEEMEGFFIFIDSGTNFKPGRYQIKNVTDSTHATVDRSPTPNGAGSGGLGYVGSRIRWWLDNQLCFDWRRAHPDYAPPGEFGDDPLGIGSMQITPFKTTKDPTQDHDTAYMWIDNMIMSSQPIPFGTAGVVGAAQPTKTLLPFLTSRI